MLSNKERAWIERNKGFILKLADLEDGGADVVPLFHAIVKKLKRFTNKNRELIFFMMDNPEYLSAVKKIMEPKFALFVNSYLEQGNLELLIRTAIDLRSGMRAVSGR